MPNICWRSRRRTEPRRECVSCIFSYTAVLYPPGPGDRSSCSLQRGSVSTSRKLPEHISLLPSYSGVNLFQFSRSVASNSATLWSAAHQASLSITNSQSLLTLMSIESVMPSNHLILCRQLLLPSTFPSIRVFSNDRLCKNVHFLRMEAHSHHSTFHTAKDCALCCVQRNKCWTLVFITTSSSFRTFFVCMCAKLLHLCLTATLWTVVHQAYLSMRILQTRILEWAAMPSCRGSSPPRDWMHVSCVSCIGRWGLYYVHHLPSLLQAIFSSGLIHPNSFFFFFFWSPL